MATGQFVYHAGAAARSQERSLLTGSRYSGESVNMEYFVRRKHCVRGAEDDSFDRAADAKVLADLREGLLGERQVRESPLIRLSRSEAEVCFD
jgi:hypothetical protein